MGDQLERMYHLMRKERNRLKTFRLNPPWPKDYIDIKKLAKAGFFYLFTGDEVHCAFCRSKLNKWDPGDDPMTEHAKYFTTCPFIMGGDVGNEPLGEDPFPGPKRPRPYDVCGAYPNFPPNDVRASQENQRTSANHPANNLYQIDCSYGNNPQELNTNRQSEIQHHNPTYDALSSDSQTQNGPSCNSSISSIGSNVSSVSLNGICKICYTNSIELVFLPCGHSVSCLSCAQRLYSCPFCRAEITTRIRTYIV